MSCDAATNMGHRHGRRGSRSASGRRTPRHARGLVFRSLIRTHAGHNSGTLVLQALILAMAVAAGGPIAMLFRAADPAGAARRLDPAITVGGSDLGDALIAGTRRFTGAGGPLHVVFATRAVSHPVAKTCLAARVSLTTRRSSLTAGTTNATAPAPASGMRLAGNGHGDVPMPASTKAPEPPDASGSTLRPAADLRASVTATRKAKNLADPDH